MNEELLGVLRSNNLLQLVQLGSPLLKVILFKENTLVLELHLLAYTLLKDFLVIDAHVQR